MSNYLFQAMAVYEVTNPNYIQSLCEESITTLGELPETKLNEEARKAKFVKCKPSEAGKIGFTEIPGAPDLYADNQKDYIAFVIMQEERKVPAQVVQLAVQAQINRIKEEQDRPVRAKEKREITDGVMVDLLPQAFSKFSTHYGYFDKVRNLLILQCTNSAKAEEICSFIRKTIGSLPTQVVMTKLAPRTEMADWLMTSPEKPETSLPDGWEYQDGVKLSVREGSDKQSSTFNNTMAKEAQVQDALQMGQEVDEILLYNEPLALGIKVSEELLYKRIHWHDFHLEKLADNCSTDEDLYHDFGCSMILNADNLGKLHESFVDALGGPR